MRCRTYNLLLPTLLSISACTEKDPIPLGFLGGLSDYSTNPGLSSAAGYDATNVVIETLKTQNNDQSIKQVILQSSPFEGIQQPISIDPLGDATRMPFLSTVRNGTFVVLQ